MYQLCIALLLFASSHVTGQSEASAVAIKTTLCELAQHPEKYLGSMVEVRASVSNNDLSIDDFEQKPACASWMGVVLVLPEQVKPNVRWEVIRDSSFLDLFASLRKGMNVQATFEGRFDAVYRWMDQKKVWVEGVDRRLAGFGKKGRYGGRLVLRQISEVLARPVYRR